MAWKDVSTMSQRLEVVMFASAEGANVSVLKIAKGNSLLNPNAEQGEFTRHWTATTCPHDLFDSKIVAVGMAIAGHLPHRPVGKELPHTKIA